MDIWGVDMQGVDLGGMDAQGVDMQTSLALRIHWRKNRQIPGELPGPQGKEQVSKQGQGQAFQEPGFQAACLLSPSISCSGDLKPFTFE